MTGEETIQLEFKLVVEEEGDEGWKQQEFTVPAKDTSFEFSLQELCGIEEGKEYAVRIRYFQRWYRNIRPQMCPNKLSFF